MRPRPRNPLCPYTDALPISYAWAREIDRSLHTFVEPVLHEIARSRGDDLLAPKDIEGLNTAIVDAALRCPRSEEHTSELQSPYDLVCCLLLEKKKLCTPPST